MVQEVIYMSTISFAKAVRKLLSTPKIKDKVGDKVFPLVADLGTKFPYIVFSRNETDEYSKDNLYQEILNYDIIVASDKYDEGVDIAELVRDELECKRIEVEGYKIVSIRVISTSESYNEAYLQQLTFEFKVNR